MHDDIIVDIEIAIVEVFVRTAYLHIMLTETFFRAALGIVLMLTISVTGFHRYTAARSGEPISRKEEGYLFAFALRLAVLLLFVVTFAYLVSPTLIQ